MAKIILDDGTTFELDEKEQLYMAGIISAYGAGLKALATGDTKPFINIVWDLEVKINCSPEKIIKVGESIMVKLAAKKAGVSEEEIHRLVNEGIESDNNMDDLRKVFE